MVLELVATAAGCVRREVVGTGIASGSSHAASKTAPREQRHLLTGAGRSVRRSWKVRGGDAPLSNKRMVHGVAPGSQVSSTSTKRTD